MERESRDRGKRIPIGLFATLQSHCPNLALLDLSNITTMAVSHAVLPLEKLQTGCPKLKVFRITNAQITLGTATLQEQVRANDCDRFH